MSTYSHKSVIISCASELLEYGQRLPEVERPTWWLFRGLSRPRTLRTSLERIVLDAGWPLSDAAKVEVQLLKDFKRHAHFYISSVPRDGDLIGWLALMQHHGAPTRLLDWTYSFYVAAFFALAGATSNPEAERKPCVVWALYRDAFLLSDQDPRAYSVYEAFAERPDGDDIGRSDSDRVQDGVNAYMLHVIEHRTKSVWAVNPFLLNETVEFTLC